MRNAIDPAEGLVAWTIDDSEFDRKLNRRVLTRSNADSEIFDFPSAQDALDELHQIKTFPHLIFLDVKMPIKDGFDFLTEATERFGESFTSRVVIMLTSSLNPSDYTRAQTFPVVKDFLSKPLTVDDAQDIAKQTLITLEGRKI